MIHDLTTIILTYNEERHIRRALENVCPISYKVFVIDCMSDDATREICHTFANVEVVEHAWPGNQAVQFNWALDNLNIETSWILRMDADEYLTKELVSEMQDKIDKMPENISAISLPLIRTFNNHRLKHGIVNGICKERIFRNGKARYDLRLMDEDLIVHEGDISYFYGGFVNDSHITISEFIQKHDNYAAREAATQLCIQYNLRDTPRHIIKKEALRSKYYRMPLYWRCFAYFIYRYIFRFGFLDGRAGFEWDFFQGLWYRMLVDAKIAEAKRRCGADREKIRNHIKNILGVTI